jgi:hypothetical protein
MSIYATGKFKNFGKTGLAFALLLAIAVSIFVLVRLVQAEPLDTYHAGWQLVRETADEDGADFATVYDLTGVGTTNGDFASMDATGVLLGGAFRIPSRNSEQGVGYSHGTKWAFAICGSNYNNVDDTFSFNVVGWSKTNGMMHNIVEGDGVIGTQAVVVYPDGGDAHGELVSSIAAVYTHADTTFTMTDELDDVVTGMLARVTGSGFTNAILQITTVTSNDSFVCSAITSTGNCTATVQINPAFWCDDLQVDELTKWSAGGAGDANTNMMSNNVAVINDGDNEVALLVLDLAGLEYIQFVFYDCDGETGDQAGNLTVYGRPY